jgi:hypothetical protein
MSIFSRKVVERNGLATSIIPILWPDDRVHVPKPADGEAATQEVSIGAGSGKA